jgi:hypothetical protein
MEGGANACRQASRYAQASRYSRHCHSCALIAISGTAALSNDSNCRQLEDLARQYAGVKLSSYQQQIKRRLVAWYQDNCKRTRTVQARR